MLTLPCFCFIQLLTSHEIDTLYNIMISLTIQHPTMHNLNKNASNR